MQNTKEILKSVLTLKPQERFMIIEGILSSLDEPAKEIDDIWSEEAEKRLAAHRSGKTQGVSYEEVFGKTS